jgi:hypothetical protein
MKDAASIAAKFFPLSATTRAFDVYALRTRAARSINRYAARLVKAERERCCGIVDDDDKLYPSDQIRLTAAINTQAKKRPSRKRK